MYVYDFLWGNPKLSFCWWLAGGMLILGIVELLHAKITKDESYLGKSWNMNVKSGKIMQDYGKNFFTRERHYTKIVSSY